jgi:flavin-dependent dehydrogenase
MSQVTSHADAIIVGGGPCGCTFATRLAQAGRSVIIIDKEPKPLAAVGESLLPFGTRVLEKLGISMDGFLRKDAAVFVRNDRSVRFPFAESARRTWTHAWQVPRDDFDGRFRAVALRAGVRFVHEKMLDVELSQDGAPNKVNTDAGVYTTPLFVDAAGRNQFLSRKLGLRRLHPVLRNTAIANHFHGVKTFEPEQPGDIAIVAYPGGWFWFIPFTGGRTSVGTVITPGANFEAQEGLGPLEGRWETALSRCPAAAARLDGAVPEGALRGLSDFTAVSERLSGDGWLLLGDAAMFLDPVFSSGVLLAIESADRAADAVLAGVGMDAWEANYRQAAKKFEGAILAWYTGEFMDVALIPAEHQHERFRQGIISLLAGDTFAPGNRAADQMSESFPILARRARENGWVST